LCTETICNACNPHSTSLRIHTQTTPSSSKRSRSNQTHILKTNSAARYITQHAQHARLPHHPPFTQMHAYHNTNSTTAPATTAGHSPRLPLNPLPAALFTPVGLALSPPAGAASFPVPSLLLAAVPCCCGRVWTSGVEDASLPGTAVPCWGGWSQPAGTCMGCWPEGPDVA